jgi:hypothetical protein
VSKIIDHLAEYIKTKISDSTSMMLSKPIKTYIIEQLYEKVDLKDLSFSYDDLDAMHATAKITFRHLPLSINAVVTRLDSVSRIELSNH